MPCSGPSQDYAHAVGDKITDEMIVILDRDYNLTPDRLMWCRHKDEMTQKFNELRAIIKDIVWIDHADSF